MDDLSLLLLDDDITEWFTVLAADRADLDLTAQETAAALQAVVAGTDPGPPEGECDAE